MRRRAVAILMALLVALGAVATACDGDDSGGDDGGGYTVNVG